jgi:hypothetical protein
LQQKWGIRREKHDRLLLLPFVTTENFQAVLRQKQAAKRASTWYRRTQGGQNSSISGSCFGVWAQFGTAHTLKPDSAKTWYGTYKVQPPSSALSGRCPADPLRVQPM